MEANRARRYSVFRFCQRSHEEFLKKKQKALVLSMPVGLRLSSIESPWLPLSESNLCLSLVGLQKGLFVSFVTDKDHRFDMSIRDLTWATVATKLATLPPIFGGLICLSCPLVCVLLSTYCVWPTSLGQPSLEKILK